MKNPFRDPWPDKPSLVGSIALFLVPLLLVGFVGYRYLTTATPVTRTQALDLFRADTGLDAAGEATADPVAEPSVSTGSAHRSKQEPTKTSQRNDRRKAESPPQQAPRRRLVAAAQTEEQGSGREERSGSSAGFEPGVPEEGVYSWATKGFESFNGAKRSFPAETQRIVTHRGANGWTNHHYFSEERESWFEVASDSDGYITMSTRNKIIFGPVHRDVTIVFDPPMRIGMVPNTVGDNWSGKWDGKTYGTYACKVFDQGTMAIDDEKVEFYAVELKMELRGETEGNVVGKFWVSSEHHMVIREEYVQNVETGPGKYYAEWQMTIKSLKPQR